MRKDVGQARWIERFIRGCESDNPFVFVAFVATMLFAAGLEFILAESGER